MILVIVFFVVAVQPLILRSYNNGFLFDEGICFSVDFNNGWTDVFTFTQPWDESITVNNRTVDTNLSMDGKQLKYENTSPTEVDVRLIMNDNLSDPVIAEYDNLEVGETSPALRVDGDLFLRNGITLQIRNSDTSDYGYYVTDIDFQKVN